MDPTFTDSCPAQVTAHSGIDSLVHAVEAITNRPFSELGDVDPQAKAYEGSFLLTRQLALEAIRLVGRHLIAAFLSPNSAEDRDGMALAATLAGMAFSNSGVGIVHALEYPIGALTHCSHGEGNGLLLPHVMSFNLEYCHEEFCEIASALDGPSDRRYRPKDAIEQVIKLQKELGIRRKLSSLGLREEHIDQVAASALGIKRLMELNRRPPNLVDLQDILRSAY